MKTSHNTGNTEAMCVLLGKAREAILHGGYDDLAATAAELSGLIRMQHPPLQGNEMSALVRPLIAVADILSQDQEYLPAAITAYVDAAHYSSGCNDDLQRQSIIKLLEMTECLPASADRIKAYHLAGQEAPANSQFAALAKHKSREQKYPGYFKMRASTELPRQDEAIIEADLKLALGDEINCVVRQQAPSGEIQYSVVVVRGFSRGRLTYAGVEQANELLRTRTGEELDRIVVPANVLPKHTRRDIDFLSRLQGGGIHVDANHGRVRDASGAVIAYVLSDGVNPDRARYMGIDTHGIVPHDGKLVVPIETIRFHADPALIGKWSWMPARGGNLRSRIPRHEHALTILSLQTYGITPCGDEESREKSGYIEVASADKGKLTNIVSQHHLQQRNDYLLKFAEALPSFASSIAVAAYKDACGTVSGLRHRKK
ncbi:MAG: hypothetical protein KJ795_07730 [Gammaproteobacteria bacterium]|nr:hypothetical protein [Gammaproteobacteria bacterium]MBU1777492.1 hypothetical protein [Gammaproteobacteria bacterium]MBU1969877.1 hypothetical protein [Gammaproteobacteria bacterium]